MIVLIDNFDSFTYNLQDYLKAAGDTVLTIRYDALDITELLQKPVSGLVISPGPGKPADYPLHFELYKVYLGKIPILGVCLGHQSLGCYFGANLAHAQKPMHGKVSIIKHTNHKMYENIPAETKVTRYHSLLIHDLPETLEATAYTFQNELMSFAHKEFDVWAFQFHPEAYLTEHGHELINNWLNLLNKKIDKNKIPNTEFGVLSKN